MDILLIALGLIVLGGLAAAAVGRNPRLATAFGVGGAVTGCVVGLVPVLRVLASGSTESLRMAWNVPYGAFFIEMDALSAFFLLPVFVLCGLAAVYGGEYLRAFWGRKSVGAAWLFYNLLIVSMVLVIVARNAVLFLVAWEVMALTSFFLVTFEDEKEEVREAGWTYLIATHLGTAFLLAMFVLLGRESGSMDFDQFHAAPATASALFLLAVIGFGTKAGFMPLHVWLPEAHPAAPSHVSAVMSGVMIKTGIYGLVRVLTFLGPPPAWWGWTLIAIGLTSGILGILFALAQQDLKRLLAYSSVENIGIITLGLGLGLLGQSVGSESLTILGFAGALLHVINHSLFKGLLFLGAGAVLHATATRTLDHLGGLLKRMPQTAAMFLIGVVAISGLPPLNGFASEFLIYWAGFVGGTTLPVSSAAPTLTAVAGLALIGGLSVACFTKAFGIVFLGEPRRQHATPPHEPGMAMRWPMFLLAAACVAIGLFSPLVVRSLAPILESFCGLDPVVLENNLITVVEPMTAISLAGAVFLSVVGLLVLLRWRLLSRREVTEGVTWDCGYAQPSPRMQYTGSSFVQPLTDLAATFLRARRTIQPPTGIFPAESALATETPDVCREGIYRPLFSGVQWSVSKLRWLQHGNVQLYVLYIALTLLVLLVWKLG